MTHATNPEWYARDNANSYDRRLPKRFNAYKEKCFRTAPIERGARVLLFCCGTGLDFAYLQRRIGPEGRIVAVDLSAEMLRRAEERCKRAGWDNVDFVESDITTFRPSAHGGPFDVGVCTLGLSIVPRCMRAYRKLTDAVRPGGTLIVSDMALTKGIWTPMNALVISMAAPYGGSYVGHRNATLVADAMERELSNAQRENYDFGSYFWCWGSKPAQSG